MERPGFGYPQAAAEYPRLIWCSITGFGQDGPYASRPGHDLTYTAHSGLLNAIHPDVPWHPQTVLAVPLGASNRLILAPTLARRTHIAGRQMGGGFVECGRPAEGVDMTLTEQPLRYIDSDGHILEPPTGMLDFAPAGYQDRIWHVETDADGTEWIVYNGARTPAGGLAGTAGFSDEDVERVRNGELTYTQTRPSGWTADLRLRDLDTDGIELSVLYPTFMLGLQSVKDIDFGRVQARAYNQWCSAHLADGKGRLFGAGALPPMHEPGDVQAVADGDPVCRESSGHGLGIYAPQPGCGLAPIQRSGVRPHLARAQDTGLPIAFHPFLAPDLPGACEGLKLARTRNEDGSYVTLDEMDQARIAAGGNFIPNIYFTQAIANPVDVMSAICFITSGGVTERFPGQIHVPRGERRVVGSVARTARPPRQEVQLGRSMAEDAALGILPPAVLDQLRPGRVDAGVHRQLAAVWRRSDHLGL